MTPEQQAELRKEFPPECIGKLPKLTCKTCSARDKNCTEHKKAKCNTCGNYISTAHIDLDYVGHAEVTDRLLTVDPEWTWEPVAFAEDGGPLIRRLGTEATLWIRLTACGITRLGVGSVAAGAFDVEKQLIGDALRNAAMRFGVALDLWSKNELESALIEEAPAPPSLIDCPEACGHQATKADMRGHLLDVHHWTKQTDGRVARPKMSTPEPTAPPAGAHEGAPDALPGVGTHRQATPSAGDVGAGDAATPPAAPRPDGPSPDGPSQKQLGMIGGLLGKLGVPDDDRHRYVSDLLELPLRVPSLKSLSRKQASRLIDLLMAEEASSVPS